MKVGQVCCQEISGEFIRRSLTVTVLYGLPNRDRKGAAT
jgi:hypothetical protein